MHMRQICDAARAKGVITVIDGDTSRTNPVPPR
jgi:hypothetical protein